MWRESFYLYSAGVVTGLGLSWLFLQVVLKTSVTELLVNRRFVSEINRRLLRQQVRVARETREQDPGRGE
jgi:hypothetical protein